MGVHIHPDNLEDNCRHLRNRIDQLYYMALSVCSEFVYSELAGLNEVLKDEVEQLAYPAIRYAKLYNNYYYENETYDTEDFELIYKGDDK